MPVHKRIARGVKKAVRRVKKAVKKVVRNVRRRTAPKQIPNTTAPKPIPHTPRPTQTRQPNQSTPSGPRFTPPPQTRQPNQSTPSRRENLRQMTRVAKAEIPSAAITPIGGAGAALAGLQMSAASSAIRSVGRKTAVSVLNKIGSIGISLRGRGTVRLISTNTKTLKATESWLGGFASQVKNPTLVVGALIGAIGSYPFAGFIKEEALQTLSFALKGAIDNNDLEGAERALEETRDVLDPTVWDNILGKIPYVNVVNELKKFYDAARTKVSIDEKIVEDLKTQLETGETDDDKRARAREEEAAQDRAAIDYYNEERKKMLRWEEEAADRDMREDAAFWAREREKQRKKEAEDRQAIADFWAAYRKEAQTFSSDNRPSNLNFGLL